MCRSPSCFTNSNNKLDTLDVPITFGLERSKLEADSATASVGIAFWNLVTLQAQFETDFAELNAEA